MNTLRCWIEAMRLRTLPVSTAGVLAAWALAISAGCFQWLPALICLAFAVMAQVASNFANEYFDYRNGLDAPGRVGPRRGVTEGDISPRTMLIAALGVLAAASALGCSLIYWGGWWLIAAGVVIVLGALAYSAGPWPLSHHGLGEVAVVLFFGIAPVTLTYYVMAGDVTLTVWLASLAMGLLGANVLVVNNYRDIDDDRRSGKRTLAVRWGRQAMLWLYFVNVLLAVWLLIPAFPAEVHYWWSLAAFAVGVAIQQMVARRTGAALNPLLGLTAIFMLLVSLSLLAVSLIFPHQ